MQIVIDIPNWLYNAILEHKEPIYSQSLAEAVRDGTPLPKHYGDLIDRNEYFQGSYNDAREFLDNAPTIIPATKEEKHCKACKYSDNGMINVESERCKACYYDGRLGGNCLFVPKQTATKEGDGE